MILRLPSPVPPSQAAISYRVVLVFAGSGSTLSSAGPWPCCAALWSGNESSVCGSGTVGLLRVVHRVLEDVRAAEARDERVELVLVPAEQGHVDVRHAPAEALDVDGRENLVEAVVSVALVVARADRGAQGVALQPRDARPRGSLVREDADDGHQVVA